MSDVETAVSSSGVERAERRGHAGRAVSSDEETTVRSDVVTSVSTDGMETAVSTADAVL